MLKIDPNVVRKALVDVYMIAYGEVIVERRLHKSMSVEKIKKHLKAKIEDHFKDLPDAAIMLTFLYGDDAIRDRAKKEAFETIDANLRDMPKD